MAVLAFVPVASISAVVACGEDYTEAAPTTPDGGDLPLEAAPSMDGGADVADAATEASCPARYMPQEGTYAYSHGYSADQLKIGDAAVTTEGFRQPFFATVTHDPNGCFTIAAFISRGANGRHDHTWRFCNTCARSEPSLDLAEETDRFEVTALSAKQMTTYACEMPNPYLVTDVSPDASIAQGACTGTGTGSQMNTIQTLPKGYVYAGPREVTFSGEDASVGTHRFDRQSQVIMTGGGAPTTDTSSFWFDVDSGALMAVIIIARTTTTFGGVPVSYQFSLGATRVSSGVTPLVPEP